MRTVHGLNDGGNSPPEGNISYFYLKPLIAFIL